MSDAPPKSGPLSGLKIVEFSGIGPGPFCAMMLADMGAEVIRVDQPRSTPLPAAYSVLNTRFDVQARGRPSISVNLKSQAGVDTVLRLLQRADASIEGFRPGVMERLGLGPEEVFERNPRLVYGRMTGWGQTGPLAHAPGHDINYIALTGALAAMGQPHEPPAVPLNLVGDLGGGGMLLAFGITCALLEAQRSGRGQIVDAAMTDGSALLMSMFYGLRAAGQWRDDRCSNLLDGGAHFYGTYRCADEKFIAIGPIEPRFYKTLLELCGIEDSAFHDQMNQAAWSRLREALAKVFMTRTRDEWCGLPGATEACIAPVLDMMEAPLNAHNRARGTFVEIDGVTQAAPAPRFSRTPAGIPSRPSLIGEHTEAILKDWNFTNAEISSLLASGSVGNPKADPSP